MRIDYADVNGVALRYAISGKGQQRLVLIHEMGGTLESWTEVTEILGSDYTMLSYDTRGSGLSEKIGGEVDIDDLTSDLLALLDHIGWTDKLLVAGCAVGAATAIRAIIRSSDRFEAMVALSPALGVDPTKREQTFAAGEKLRAVGVREATDPGWDRVFPPSLRTDAVRTNAVRCRKLGNDPVSFAALYRMVGRMDLSGELPGLACPSLFLAGSFDKTRTPDMVRAAADMVPGSEYMVVESGHVMHAMTPELVASAMDSFFKSREKISLL